jgi:dihydrofolate reductase
MAVSANGIIATKDGGEDFLSDTTWKCFAKRANEIGCTIWGRKTYEAVLKYDQHYLDDIKNVRKVVVSRSGLEMRVGYSLVKSPESALELLGSEGFNEILISGGSTLNAEFAKQNLIDEIILDVNPIVLGNGIPVFSGSDFEMRLNLKSAKIIEGGNLELVYEVLK